MDQLCRCRAATAKSKHRGALCKMHFVFLGTASCFPTPSRGVSCLALRWDTSGDVWLFDCGEGSQIQLQRSFLKPGKISKIFVTHLHGDHVFGLPGLLCTLGNGCVSEDKVVHVFGPLGIKKLVKTSLELSQSQLPFRCVFHELVPRRDQLESSDTYVDIDRLKWQGGESDVDDEEIEFHETLRCWRLTEEKSGSPLVVAGALRHRIPSFAYVISEPDQPGSLNVEKLLELGLPPGPKYAQLKRGKAVYVEKDEELTLVTPEQALGPPKRGRKVAVLGDTCDDTEIVDLCADCDLVVHEATMEETLKEKAVEYGHSTPKMAAEFAAAVGAKRLCLTHVSPRYKPISSTEVDKRDSSAQVLLNEARQYLDELKYTNCEVLIAEDFFELSLEKRQ